MIAPASVPKSQRFRNEIVQWQPAEPAIAEQSAAVVDLHASQASYHLTNAAIVATTASSMPWNPWYEKASHWDCAAAGMAPVTG
jgi:hypothetical protein